MPARIEDRAAMALGVCTKQADRFGEARHWFEEMVHAAREEGDESSLPHLLAHMADLECWAGNWPAAERPPCGWAARTARRPGRAADQLWITDPDGYRIELVQWAAGHADGITKADFT